MISISQRDNVKSLQWLHKNEKSNFSALHKIVNYISPPACLRTQELGLDVIHGDGTDPYFLALTGIYPPDILILTTSSDEANLMITGLTWSIFDVDRIIAKLYDSAHAKA